MDAFRKRVAHGMRVLQYIRKRVDGARTKVEISIYLSFRSTLLFKSHTFSFQRPSENRQSQHSHQQNQQQHFRSNHHSHNRSLHVEATLHPDGYPYIVQPVRPCYLRPHSASSLHRTAGVRKPRSRPCRSSSLSQPLSHPFLSRSSSLPRIERDGRSPSLSMCHAAPV